MIRNERQYKVTKSEADRFARALAALDASSEELTPRRLLERSALESQLGDLKSSMEQYDLLRSGHKRVVEIDSLADLPRVLVEARIAASLTQRDLGERLGLKEQQIQRYEATDYQGASVGRLLAVAKALDINVHKEVYFQANENDAERLVRRLESTGLDRRFIRRRLTRSTDSAASASETVFKTASAASRVFGWTPGQILGADTLAVEAAPLAGARFKVPNNAERRRLSVYTAYAHYLALQTLQATADLPQPAEMPVLAEEFRAGAKAAYGSLSFEKCLRFVWDSGVPVLPLRDAGAFHGACWRSGGRNVIVLKQQTQSLYRWLFDLVHEYGHATQDPDDSTFSVVEPPEDAPERQTDEREIDANNFAADVILDGRADELVKMCQKECRGRTEWLKKAVLRIAEQEGVAVSALANHLAFLLGKEWWATAQSLQELGDPWRIARDEFLRRADLSRLSPIDRDLLMHALTDLDGDPDHGEGTPTV